MAVFDLLKNIKQRVDIFLKLDKDFNKARKIISKNYTEAHLVKLISAHPNSHHKLTIFARNLVSYYSIYLDYFDHLNNLILEIFNDEKKVEFAEYTSLNRIFEGILRADSMILQRENAESFNKHGHKLLINLKKDISKSKLWIDKINRDKSVYRGLDYFRNEAHIAKRLFEVLSKYRTLNGNLVILEQQIKNDLKVTSEKTLKDINEFIDKFGDHSDVMKEMEQDILELVEKTYIKFEEEFLELEKIHALLGSEDGASIRNLLSRYATEHVKYHKAMSVLRSVERPIIEVEESNVRLINATLDKQYAA